MKGTVIQRRGVNQAKERTGYCVPAGPIQAGFLSVEIELTRRLGEPADVELEHPDFSAKLHIVLAFDPADGIIQLVHVVSELGIATVVQQSLVRRAGELHAGKCSWLNSGETDLRWKVLAVAVGGLTAETAAESE